MNEDRCWDEGPEQSALDSPEQVVRERLTSLGRGEPCVPAHQVLDEIKKMLGLDD